MRYALRFEIVWFKSLLCIYIPRLAKSGREKKKEVKIHSNR